MRNIIIFLLIIMLSLICINTFAEKMTIAIMDLKSENVPKIITNAVTDIIRSEFVNIENFGVTERGQMDKILNEQKLQLSGILDDQSAVKIGELLSAQKVVLGEINSLEKDYIITLRIVDVETGESEFSAREKVEDMDELDAKAVVIARDLAQRIVSGNKEYFSAISPSGYYLRGAVPGWGQFYVNKPVKGIISSTLFTGSAVLSVLAYLDYKNKEEEYQSLALGSPDFDSNYDAYDTSVKMFNYSIILVGSTYLLHWIDIIFLSKPDFGGKDKQSESGVSILRGFFIEPRILDYTSDNIEISIGFRN